jgi:voltage-gated potassium channel
MLVGIGVLTLLTATVASILVEKKITKDLGMHSYNFENHIILCEWNYRAEIILKELRLETDLEKAPIVLIADIDRKPIKDKHLFFVRGEVCDETLQQANLLKAKTVIILGDDNLDYKQRDAKVILSTLTVESINKDAYTIVELINENNIKNCNRAKADEIIVSSKLSSNLISSAAINHGISRVISDIVTYEYGSQIFKIAVPESEVGHLFIDVFMTMKQDFQSTVIAIQQGDDGKTISNPSPDYKLKINDYLIFIGSRGKSYSSKFIES